jgi:hypothetical protein
MLYDLRFVLCYVFAVVVVVWLPPIEFWLARLAACECPYVYHHVPDRPNTTPVCSNCFNMPFDLRFVPGYVFPAVVVVVSACDFEEKAEKCGAAQFDRLPAHYCAPSRLDTIPVCSNRLYIFPDLRFMLAYVFPVVVVVLGASERVLAQRSGLRERPPAHYHAPSRLATVPICSNRLYMFPNLRFILTYVFPAVVVVLSTCDGVLRLGLRLKSAHLHTTTHLDV